MTTRVAVIPTRAWCKKWHSRRARHRLSFAYSPRPGVAEASNGVEVWWNGQLLETVSASGQGLSQTDWRTFSFDLPADADVGRIEFRVGTEDSVGGYIDDVSLRVMSEAVVSQDVRKNNQRWTSKGARRTVAQRTRCSIKSMISIRSME
ncbi:MAG: hypothetical protein R3B96_01335 [Pirellulaceae bacterium]